MFGKKKAPLPECIRLMHYEGLPGFAQDAPCFMEQTAEALVFRRVEGPSVTLPLAKVDSLDIMDERNFAPSTEAPVQTLPAPMRSSGMQFSPMGTNMWPFGFWAARKAKSSMPLKSR